MRTIFPAAASCFVRRAFAPAPRPYALRASVWFTLKSRRGDAVRQTTRFVCAINCPPLEVLSCITEHLVIHNFIVCLFVSASGCGQLHQPYAWHTAHASPHGDLPNRFALRCLTQVTMPKSAERLAERHIYNHISGDKMSI